MSNAVLGQHQHKVLKGILPFWNVHKHVQVLIIVVYKSAKTAPKHVCGLLLILFVWLKMSCAITHGVKKSDMLRNGETLELWWRQSKCSYRSYY